MSNIDPNAERDATLDQRQKQSFLSREERELVQRYFGFPEEIPGSFMPFVQDWLGANGLELGISQIRGYKRLVTNRGTTFPKEPLDTQPFIYVVDEANGIEWPLRYSEKIADDYKWVNNGGAPLYSQLSTESSTISTSYVNLGGPGVVVPKRGIYRVDFGASLQNNVADSDVVVGVAYGGSSPVDTESIQAEGIVAGGVVRTAQSRTHVITVTSDSQAVDLRYKVGSGTGTYRNRWILVTPIRIAS